MGFNFVYFLKFLIFIIVWIQIPGSFLDHILVQRKQKRFYAVKLLSGFVLGTVFMTLLYYLQGLLKSDQFITVIGPLFSVICIAYWLYKGRPTLFSYGRHNNLEQHIIFIVLLIMAVLSFTLKWALAPTYDHVQINHDVLYHVGNIVTLSKGVPAMDPRVYGISFFYHYQYDLIYAMAKNVFHMDAYSLYISGMPILAAWPMGLAMIVLGDRCFSKREHTDLENVAGRKVKFSFKYLFYLLGFLFSGVCIYPLIILSDYFPLSWLNYHVYTNINSMGLAIAAAVIFIDVVSHLWNEKTDVRHLILFFAYSFFATGAKGPTGHILLSSVLFVAVIQALIEKKFNTTRCWYFISSLLGFVFCYVIMVAGFSGTGGNNRAVSIDPTGTIRLSRVANVFNKYLNINPYELSVVWIVEILIVVCLVGPGILSVLWWFRYRLRRLSKDKYLGDIFDWFSLCMICVSIGGCLLISIEGFSQGYMVLTAAPFIYYSIMRFMQKNKAPFLHIIQKAAFLLGAAFFLADAVFFVSEDLKNEGYTYDTDPEKAWVTSGELQGYIWLRDNTEEDAIIATDRRSENIDYRSTFFYISSIGERQVFLEGHSYSNVDDDVAEKMIATNRTFYSSSPQVAETAMEANGIDYLVVSNITHHLYERKSQRLKPVYTNGDIRIYKFE